MFEDKPTNPNQPTPGGLPPANLPTANQPTVAKEPDDILAEFDPDEPRFKGPEIPTSPMPTPASAMPIPPAIPAPEKPITKEPFFKAHKKAFLIIVIVLVASGALAAGGWFFYQRFVGTRANPNQPGLNTGQTATNANQAANTNQAAANQNINQNVTPPPPTQIDSDFDGLSDEEEGMYGTDLNKIDNDEDGLTDRDEVKVFKTDPNNADTDGDGFMDGEEIRAGFDPKGPGKLLEIK